MPSIDVLAPLRAVYDRWTSFEAYPEFLPAFLAVHRDGVGHLRVRLSSGEFPAQVIEQHLDERVAWRSVAGPHHAGAVTLRPLGDAVLVGLELEGAAGDAREVLERFKALAEADPDVSEPAGAHDDILYPGATRGLGDDASSIRG